MSKMKKMLVAVVVVSAISGLAVAAPTYYEGFETGWANGVSGNLSDGTYPWTIRTPGNWSIQDDGAPQNNVLQFNGAMNNEVWWTGGGQHGVTIPPTYGKAVIDLHVRVKQDPTAVTRDNAWVWLSDSNQNGYGVNIYKAGNGNNYAGIRKLRNSTTAFGGVPGWSQSSPMGYSQVGTDDDDFIHYHIRLSQTGSGPLTVWLWQTESNMADTSFMNPLQVWTDDGVSYGSIIDLTSLTWVGVTADNNWNGENLPHAFPFDDIFVMLIPEPSVAMLLGLGGLMFLRRAKGVRRGARSVERRA
jgi:hypothetical protein